MVSTQTQKPTSSPFEGLQRIIIDDPFYPSNLLELEHAPGTLWTRGELQKSDRVSVAVIGSRRCSAAAQDTAHQLGAQLARAGVVVISGLALGIDGAAHRGALSADGRTLAVVGTGLHHLYPQEHQELALEIERAGALISQFQLDFPGSRNSFLKRNYVLSGMAQVLVVVEGRAKSGTTSAVRGALAQGRSVGLCAQLVQAQDWARTLIETGQAFTVHSVDDILRRVEF